MRKVRLTKFEQLVPKVKTAKKHTPKPVVEDEVVKRDRENQKILAEMRRQKAERRKPP